MTSSQESLAIPNGGGSVTDAAHWRAQFDLPQAGRYLASHSVGCLPKAARAAIDARFIEPWRSAGVYAWGPWLSAIDEFRRALALAFNARPDDICPQPTVSAALHAILGALPVVGSRRVWLTSEATFPSLGYVLERARSSGIELRLIPAEHDPSNPATWLDELADDVAGVLMMHVHSNTGAVSPIEIVARECRARGIVTVVDLAQSAGVLPVDAQRFGADFLIGSCVKWLCGGPGAGYLWVRPDILPALQPTCVGWFSHEDPFEMDIRDFRYAADAKRFWGGTPSVVPYVIAAASLGVMAGIGAANIFAHNRMLVQSFLARIPENWGACVDLARNGGTLCLDVGERKAAFEEALQRRGVVFDSRGSRIRLSFHVYNSMDDVDVVAEAWCAAARRGS